MQLDARDPGGREAPRCHRDLVFSRRNLGKHIGTRIVAWNCSLEAGRRTAERHLGPRHDGVVGVVDRARDFAPLQRLSQGRCRRTEGNQHTGQVGDPHVHFSRFPPAVPSRRNRSRDGLCALYTTDSEARTWGTSDARVRTRCRLPAGSRSTIQGALRSVRQLNSPTRDDSRVADVTQHPMRKNPTPSIPSNSIDRCVVALGNHAALTRSRVLCYVALGCDGASFRSEWRGHSG